MHGAVRSLWGGLVLVGMPTWLAIAIPSVVAVAAILMWVLDYSKKAHEIQKLGLELEKLKRESERSEREYEFEYSGLYRPTPAEVDASTRIHKRAKGIVFEAATSPRWRPRFAGLRSIILLALIAVIAAIFLYGSIRLAADLVRAFSP
jgi:hypothetical protein